MKTDNPKVFVLVREYWENYCNPHGEAETLFHVVDVFTSMESAERAKISHPKWGLDNFSIVERQIKD